MHTATEAVLPLVPSDEERQIRDAVRGICDGFPEDYARRKHEAGEPPTELWDALAAKGYLGVNLPEEWGGGGLGMTGLATVGEEIASAGKSLLLIVVSPAIVGNILARHGTDAQKERWLRGIAAGTTKIAFAITEPDAGTNSHNLATSVERRGDRLVLRGQKTYISGVEHADAVLVVARSRLPDGKLGLPSLCLVDVDAPGFTRDAIPMPYIGPDQQWTLFFDDVELHEERLIGGEGGGLGPVFDGLNPERIMGAAVAAGAGRRALE
ncbi:MAG TPA: acyl-CoA dehydrogenase family protein, partial [Thermoleophilaceae bacterium]|nr:acyl-CoA dehydrogenase family protein [Thermoleophilaceae bacterium]